MVTVLTSHKWSKDAVREEEAVAVVTTVDVDVDEDAEEGTTATVWSSMA